MKLSLKDFVANFLYKKFQLFTIINSNNVEVLQFTCSMLQRHAQKKKKSGELLCIFYRKKNSTRLPLFIILAAPWIQYTILRIFCVFWWNHVYIPQNLSGNWCIYFCSFWVDNTCFEWKKRERKKMVYMEAWSIVWTGANVCQTTLFRILVVLILFSTVLPPLDTWCV